jgi:carbonic anhydrase
MSATDDLLANNETYVASFDKGDLPMPRARRWRSSPAWMPASTSTARSACRRATRTSFAMRGASQWAAESFTDPEVDVCQSVARIKANPFIPHTDRVRGFVFEVKSGALREVV